MRPTEYRSSEESRGSAGAGSIGHQTETGFRIFLNVQVEQRCGSAPRNAARNRGVVDDRFPDLFPR